MLLWLPTHTYSTVCFRATLLGVEHTDDDQVTMVERAEINIMNINGKANWKWQKVVQLSVVECRGHDRGDQLRTTRLF